MHSCIMVVPTDSNRRQRRTPEQNSLVDRLLVFLGDRISADSNDHHSGLTLPAAAVSWLTNELLLSPDVDDSWSLFKTVLPHATHLRITNDPWPASTSCQPRTKKSVSCRRSGLVPLQETVFHNPTLPTTQQLRHYPPTPTLSRPVPTSPISESKRRRRADDRSSNCRIIDLNIFSGLHVLWLDHVPLEWLVQHPSTSAPYPYYYSQTVQVLRIESICIHQTTVADELNNGEVLVKTTFKDLHQSLVTTTMMEHKEDTMTAAVDDDPLLSASAETPLNAQRIGSVHHYLFPSLTHFKLSYCCWDEQVSSLRVPQCDGRSKQRSRTIPLFMQIDRISPVLQSICLSHNDFQREEDALPSALVVPQLLCKLDLSYNLLTALPNVHIRLGRCLATLNLSHNSLTTVTGVDQLVSLQVLHLDHNQLTDLHATVSALAYLSNLQELHLQGNPLQYTVVENSSSNGRRRYPWQPLKQEITTDEVNANVDNQDSAIRRRLRIKSSYRVDVLNAFRERRLAALKLEDVQLLSLRDVQHLLPVLDDVVATAQEVVALRARTFAPVAALRPSLKGVTGKPTRDQRSNTSLSLVFREYINHVELKTKLLPQRRRGRSAPIVNDDSERQGQEATTAAVDPLIHSSSPTVAYSLAQIVLDDSLFASPRTNCWKNAITINRESKPTTRVLKTDSNNTGIGARDILFALQQQQEGEEKIERLNLEENLGVLYLAAVANTVSSISDSSSKEVSGDDRKRPSRHHHVKAASALIANDSCCAVEVLRTCEPLEVSLVELEGKETTDELPTPLEADQSKADNDLGTVSLSMIMKGDHDDDKCPRDPKASAAATATATPDEDNYRRPKTQNDQSIAPAVGSETQPAHTITTPNKTPARNSINISSSCGDTSSYSSNLSPTSPNTNKLSLRISSFSENHWQDDNMLPVPSSLETYQRDQSSPTTLSLSRKEVFALAEKYCSYDGPRTYKNLVIRENLELYFRLFVFVTISTSSDPSFSAVAPGRQLDMDGGWREILQRYPRIQLWPMDRSQQDKLLSSKNKMSEQFAVVGSAPREAFRRVWKEKVVACGKAALRRLTPSRAARFGFHGELLWSAAETSHMKPEIVVECRETICCFSDTSFYIIVDHDGVTNKSKDQKRDFPFPIPEGACFKDAKWPHALACHSFETLVGITIGFGFQRLTLHFTESSSLGGLTYILLTSNKLETVAILKEIQELASEVNVTMFGPPKHRAPIQIENDDRHVLDALGAAVAPDTVGVILHYQILQQRWNRGGRGTVRRVCVITDSKLFLLDEDYVGDGSESIEAGSGCVIGESMNRLVDSADLNQIMYVQAAYADPNAITIVIKPSKLKRSHNWRLLCRDGHGAEKLVEDVRKAISLGVV